ncbi:HAD family hydrolase [Leifsonia sp. Root112D2]|uniref:HAD family hydrolase n=1 Tax=Leifsonia sp. Root112D2 TaxID=1736426 RepID=UPI000AAA8CB5|nr:HAD family phosphatase [Leifsonia sp. Root112D2]
MTTTPAAASGIRQDQLPAAVLFDMDGTLVDTEPYWMQAETDLVAEFGGVWTQEDCLSVVGAGLWTSAEALRARGVALEADEIVDRLTNRVQEQIETFGAPWRPGAVELLREVRERGIKTALVTMSVRRMASQIADALPFTGFDLLVTGDSVENPKPHPEAYLTAARLLGVEPECTVAIEDSIPGLAAAVAAGTTAIAVPHILQIPASDDHVLWQSLAGRTVDDLIAVYAQRNPAERNPAESTAR